MHAMSVLRIWLLLCLLALPAAAAPERDGTASKGAQEEESGMRPAELYAALAAAETPVEARLLELQIAALWLHTESPSAALVLDQASRLWLQGEFTFAKQKLDLLTDVAPGYVGAWNLRAQVNWKLEHYEQAVADLKRVLELEPKHFQALALLGTIFEELNDPKSALKAFEAAIEINPHMEGITNTVRRLTEEIKGRDI